MGRRKKCSTSITGDLLKNSFAVSLGKRQSCSPLVGGPPITLELRRPGGSIIRSKAPKLAVLKGSATVLPFEASAPEGKRRYRRRRSIKKEGSSTELAVASAASQASSGPTTAMCGGRPCLVLRDPTAWQSPASATWGALCCGLRASDQDEASTVVYLSPGELLMAVAGVHDKWTLSPAAADAALRILRPSSALVVPSEWKLMAHQAEGYLWLMARASAKPPLGAVLADGMGLGKTRQALAWLLGTRAAFETCFSVDGVANACASGMKRKWRALVVAPAMLVRGSDSVWMKELRAVSAVFGCEPLNILPWIGERVLDLQTIFKVGEWKGPLADFYDVVVTSYDTLVIHQEEICRQKWSCVILDEAQAIKNHDTQAALVTKRLASAPHRLALTGSPVENSLDDLHSILQFVQPDAVESLREFRQRFRESQGGYAALRRLLNLLVLRREPGGHIQMVSREEVDVSVRMAPAQAALYDAVLTDQALSPIKRLKDLELICSHPWCYINQAECEARARLPSEVVVDRLLGGAESQMVEDSGKVVELFHILRGILSCGKGEKAIVFTSRAVTSLLLGALVKRELGDRAGVLTGLTDHCEREGVLRAFRAPSAPGVPPMQVLLLSVWVGAVGLNLPEARWVIHFERVWNPALEKQATSRAHRITSTKPVKAYCLCTEATVEERKRAVLDGKKELSANILRTLEQDPEVDVVVDTGTGNSILGSEIELEHFIMGRNLGADTFMVEKAAGSIDDAGIDDAASNNEDGVDNESETDGARVEEGSENYGPYPSAASLRPRRLERPGRGKYGNPRESDLWDWYAVSGHREVHPRAAVTSTAGALLDIRGSASDRLAASERSSGKASSRPFSSRATRLHDVASRADVVYEVSLGDSVYCRLFVPREKQAHFMAGPEPRSLRLRVPERGEAPFPVFTPSCGRSASDPEAGLLDLTPTMLGNDGEALSFVHIVAVKASEVAKYRASAPFFVVMELPNDSMIRHPLYDVHGAEDLGVGFSRHSLMRLAEALALRFVFMLDDSVLAWYGVTLAYDSLPLFGGQAGSRVQFTPLSFGQLLQHFGNPVFLEHDMQKLSVVGFARYRPEMSRCSRAYKRAHVYSAYLVNVERVLQDLKVNFRPELFIWEDLDFNHRVLDVCKCYRFAMIKKPFTAGGCSRQVARPAVARSQPLGTFRRLTPEELAAEALSTTALVEAGCEDDVPDGSAEVRPLSESLRPKQGRKHILSVPGLRLGELESLMRLEDHKSLTIDGAVVDEAGDLVCNYYKDFINPFKVREGANALVRPGLYRDRGETESEGLRLWDDTRRKENRLCHYTDVAGAGWIAQHPWRRREQRKLCQQKWFNIKVWGSWRLAFVLARLQRAVWDTSPRPSPGPVDEVLIKKEPEGPTATLSASTPSRASKRGKGEPENSGEKRVRTSRSAAPVPTIAPTDLFGYFRPLTPTPDQDAGGVYAPLQPVQSALDRYFQRSSAASSPTRDF